jgi:hypothetical protein
VLKLLLLHLLLMLQLHLLHLPQHGCQQGLGAWLRLLWLLEVHEGAMDRTRRNQLKARQGVDSETRRPSGFEAILQSGVTNAQEASVRGGDTPQSW